MEFSDGMDRAGDFARAALAMMERYGVRPTPKNYWVWYAHCSKAYPDLSRVIEGMIAAGDEFTDERSAELFNQFFELDMEVQAIRQTGALIEASITKVLERLDQAGADTARYGERLHAYSGQLARSAGTDDLRTIVDNILAETQGMRQRSERLMDELKQSSAEIVELKRNIENVRREAHMDSLTGVANRRSFDLRLRDAVRQADEEGEPLSLLMVDIDHFKRFNDHYGHQVGDRVLQLVARVLTSSVKGRDTVARYGGEEFALILPQTALPGAGKVAEQIRSGVESRQIIEKGTGEAFGSITLSVGVTCYRSGEALESLVQRADAALYVAKREGRNRVVAEPAQPRLAVS